VGVIVKYCIFRRVPWADFNVDLLIQELLCLNHIIWEKDILNLQFKYSSQFES